MTAICAAFRGAHALFGKRLPRLHRRANLGSIGRGRSLHPKRHLVGMREVEGPYERTPVDTLSTGSTVLRRSGFRSMPFPIVRWKNITATILGVKKDGRTGLRRRQVSIGNTVIKRTREGAPHRRWRESHRRLRRRDGRRFTLFEAEKKWSVQRQAMRRGRLARIGGRTNISDLEAMRSLPTRHRADLTATATCLSTRGGIAAIGSAAITHWRGAGFVGI